ncbi:MAG: T9SS type A sorting domain-containing protein [Crocinitomix sp.]|nr:T9SS type A sorting domain-containing protein [Crocinitomix sp.]
MQKAVLALSLLFFLSSGWSQTENSWDKKASFDGLKREKAVAFSIGEFGYVGCGVDTAEITHNDLWLYDPALDTWTQKASMPAVERRDAVGFAVNGKGYIGTGFTLDDGALGEKLNDFWEYDPLSNSWSSIADYPGGDETGIYQATAFVALEKGYVACGKIGSDAYIFELWEYNPATDLWTERTPFPGGDRYQLISFVIEDKAYVGMGTDHDVYRKDMYEYDPATNTWEEKGDFPGTERARASTFSIGNKGFVVFGSDGGLKDELWEYNYYTEAWTLRAAFPGGGRYNAIAFSIGDKGYAGLGKEISGKKQTIYEYTPLGPLSITESTAIEFDLFPNPITEQATVMLPEKLNKGEYWIVNLQGQLVQKNKFNASQFTIERNGLVNGFYQLALFDQHQQFVGTKKIALR